MHQNETKNQQSNLIQEGYQQALDLLYRSRSPYGFLASPSDRSNYKRVWGRDGAILGLAALASEQPDLIEASKKTLQTLACYQGPHGEIPSNVDPEANRISYGGMAGRIDADLWFIIGCGEYWLATNDDAFLEEMVPYIEKVCWLLGAWEFNTRGLLYIPQTGDWADEYLHHGYVLYDQLLYLQAKRTLNRMHCCIHQSADHSLIDSMNRLKHLIQANYWIEVNQEPPDEVYHDVLFEKGKLAARKSKGKYWLPYFSPHGYGYRFDAFANVLASLFGVANPYQQEAVDDYISSITSDQNLNGGHSIEGKLLPAFLPVITPIDEDWEDLQTMFSYSFKNKPYEFHNGGLWPMITGFYVVDLVKRGKHEEAKTFFNGIHIANSKEMNESSWSFPEYLHGKTYTAEGTQYQGWSAAAAIIGQQALNGHPIFRSLYRE